MRAQQMLNKVWEWLGEDRRLLEILLALFILQTLVVLLPQSPVAGPAYSRWLAEQRITLKDWANPLSTLGFLTLRTSAWMRMLLVLLALSVAAQAGDLVERWGTLSHFHRWLRMGVCIGGVLVIVGWGMQVLWGWKRADVIVWPGEPVTIADMGLTLPPRKSATALFTERYGLYLIPKGNSVGLIVRAVDQQGQILPLSPSARDEPQTELRIVLTDETPEAYFALPQVGFVFRVSRLRGNGMPVQAQVYRIADGELLAETAFQGDGILAANDVRLQLDRYALPRFEAVYNPGALLEAMGLLALLIAILGFYYLRRKTAVQPVEDVPDGIAATD